MAGALFLRSLSDANRDQIAACTKVRVTYGTDQNGYSDYRRGIGKFIYGRRGLLFVQTD